jgi:hypothetical protein
MTSFDRTNPKFAPLFDVDLATGLIVEILFADRTLETFGRGGAGWFWHFRQRGFAPDSPAHGPFL